MRITATGITDVGRKRDRNEDAAETILAAWSPAAEPK